MMDNIKVGDWVRFYREGKLVIGVVQYIGHKDCLGNKEISTDNGVVREDYIKEIRLGIRTDDLGDKHKPDAFYAYENMKQQIRESAEVIEQKDEYLKSVNRLLDEKDEQLKAKQEVIDKLVEEVKKSINELDRISTLDERKVWANNHRALINSIGEDDE